MKRFMTSFKYISHQHIKFNKAIKEQKPIFQKKKNRYHVFIKKKRSETYISKEKILY